MARISRALLAAVLCLVTGASARAQQRPLLTEDPESIGAGQVLVEAGVEGAYRQRYPVSGLRGNLVKIPTLGISFGISAIAEMQLDGGLYDRLAIRERNASAPLAYLVDVPGNVTSDVDDLVIGMKVRIAPERGRRPSFGFRFATKLPNADTAPGLGPDTVDFFASILTAKTARSVRMAGNIGLGILSDATDGTRQNDVLTYGFSLAHAVTDRTALVGELNGRVSTRAHAAFPGTESRGLLRVGGRYRRGSARLDSALYFGLTPDDPRVGLTLGVTYIFHAFDVP